MKTTNEHGGVVEDDDEDPGAGRSLYQMIQDTTGLCQCCPCLRPNRRENENDDLEEEQILLRNGKIKKKVIPNTNQDTWLKYIVMNLGEMDDIIWVQELASTSAAHRAKKKQAVLRVKDVNVLADKPRKTLTALSNLANLVVNACFLRYNCVGRCKC